MCIYLCVAAVVLHYYGNSWRNTGDWCFGEECITFRQIAELYMNYSLNRTLTIVTDCHSSGHWVNECGRFLDEKGVNGSGTIAREKGILLKVFASCRPGQDSTELLHTIQGINRKENDLYFPSGIEIRTSQETFAISFLYGYKWESHG